MRNTVYGILLLMIGYLEGTVKSTRAAKLILLVGGVGYELSCTKQLLSSLHPGEPWVGWVHTHVREDTFNLYGFTEEEELRFFELLLTVSGVGPRSALAILDIASTETLRTAIAKGEAEYLTKVSGIGRKTAEKIVLELRDKVGVASEETHGAMRGDEEALEAMRALGYSHAEARDTLRKVPASISGSSERLREALKILGR